MKLFYKKEERRARDKGGSGSRILEGRRQKE